MFSISSQRFVKLAARDKAVAELHHAPILLVAMRRFVVRLAAGPQVCDDASAASTHNGEADTSTDAALHAHGVDEA